MKRIIVIGCLMVASICLATESPIATFAAKFEDAIAKRVEVVTQPRRRLQTEYMARQDYALQIEQEQKRLVQSDTLSTPEVERLRAERKALFEQIESLTKAIQVASLEAPEIKELQAVMKANEERIGVLRQALMPESLREKTSQENNP